MPRSRRMKGLRKYKEQPDIFQNLNSENMRMFFTYMYRRHVIWVRRFQMRLPREAWTDDPILSRYKFTNVYRELDRNTQWLIENVIKKEKDQKEVFWKIVLFRYFNKPELFEFMGLPSSKMYDASCFCSGVLAYKAKLGRVFTDAYTVNPPKALKDRKLGLERFYCKHVESFWRKLDYLWNILSKEKDAAAWNNILVKELDSVAAFLAYEIYCDMTYTDFFQFKDKDFVNVGPGARFGLRLLFPSLPRTGKIFTEKLVWLVQNEERLFRSYGFDFPYLDKKDGSKGIGMRGIEHSLCEFSKYWKMFYHAGKSRKKFSPRS